MTLESRRVPCQAQAGADGACEIRAQKAEIRRQARQARQQLSANLRRWKDVQISRAVLACDSLAKACTVCLYWSLPEEVGTRGLISHCLERGKQLALPCHSTERTLRLVGDLERDLVPGKSPGILEPDPKCPVVAPESIEAFLLPGVAFDIYGHRIGFGGGYFDHILAQRNPNSFAGALAYGCQMFRKIPFDSQHDRPVEQVFTEETVYAFHRSEGVTQNAMATADLARALASRVSGAFRLGLVGPLGVGKTTFIRGFVEELGFRGTVTSPSFVLMSEYKARLPVRHIDLYRLGERQPSEEDLQMFLETIHEFPGVVLLEWANFAHSWLPLGVPQIRLDFQGQADDRRVILETYRPEDLPLHEVLS